ncbi:hypothetical protein GCM10010331_09340 [Streptomyces xanthochromogenes]|nr:hypothetical protein GCM10010331_09340 [Streptomyces xanthochromogenes]
MAMPEAASSVAPAAAMDFLRAEMRAAKDNTKPNFGDMGVAHRRRFKDLLGEGTRCEWPVCGPCGSGDSNSCNRVAQGSAITPFTSGSRMGGGTSPGV